MQSAECGVWKMRSVIIIIIIKIIIIIIIIIIVIIIKINKVISPHVRN